MQKTKGSFYTEVCYIVTPQSSLCVLELGFPYSLLPLTNPSGAVMYDMTLALTLGST